MQENSSSLHGLQNITTCSAFVDGTSSSTLKELVIRDANNEECLRSGLQKCLTLLHFITAVEGLSFFSSKFPGLVELGKRHGVQQFFSPKHQKKKTATQITPTATQFNFRVAETAMQNFDSKFIPVIHTSNCIYIPVTVYTYQ